MRKGIAVLGAGIAGLTAAYRLAELKVPVTVYEAQEQAGGVVQTVRTRGYLLELGPNSIRASSPWLERLIDALGLTGEVVEAAATAKKRYVVRDGALQALPASPPGLLTTSVLSLVGKLRLLREPFIRPGGRDVEESVAAFVHRRFGREVLEYLADPFVSGIFAGDPRRLSLPHAFPLLHRLEQKHGSVLQGLVRRKKEAGSGPDTSPRYGLFSFRNGLSVLPKAMAGHLGDRLQLGARVDGLEPVEGGWRVRLDDGSGATFDGVLSTLPLHRLAEMDLPEAMAPGCLGRVEYAPVAVVSLGFRRDEVAHALDGFGVLIPGVESSFQTLGILFPSSLFPGRAPEGHVLLTVLLGGTRHPEQVKQKPDLLVEAALGDVRRLLGARGTPVFTCVQQWERAIPQYNLGYGAVKAQLDRLEQGSPGLWMAGNYRQGVSLPDTMAAALDAVQRIVDYLA